ncbi:TIGR01244 family sulfur transferase [Candidatus Halocynthiibacter alkanivorans]|uniref:TIGR01244 family sulfur transferase n=1 Tax=Candidatus Halocynthiibacter alkanivorans TaxID=2267619 RepID=UPI000DF1CC6A|nr:TIGR01244 family sulfur transferase [Candidatus Halocynthiibacter alkanivorans]
MDISKLSPAFSVCGQIHPDDMSEIGASGFRAVICNRPDAEVPGQPPVQVIRNAAEKAGLELRYIPVTHTELTADKAAEIQAALRELPEPVLAYCASGRRSAMLWTMLNPGR